MGSAPPAPPGPAAPRSTGGTGGTARTGRGGWERRRLRPSPAAAAARSRRSHGRGAPGRAWVRPYLRGAGRLRLQFRPPRHGRAAALGPGEHRTATAPPPHRTAPLRGPSGSRGGGGDGTGRVLARGGRGATVRGGQRATEGCSCTGLLGGGTGEREGERAWAHPRVGARPRVHVSAARRSTRRARGCPQETAPTAARIRRTWPRPNAGRGPAVAVSRPDGAVRRTPPASKMAAAALSPPARPHRMFAARRAETGPSGMRSPTARFRAPAAAPPPGAGGPGR